MRNVEIKARVRNFAYLIKKAKLLSNSEGTLIPQKDTFFHVPGGRLKLRKYEEGDAELIYYERPDVEGPKISSYEKCPIQPTEIESLSSVLGRALGITGVVEKVRQLFIVGQTRIHVDKVEGLGEFMELEVALNSDQSLQDGEVIAHNLMKELGVDSSDLLSGAYHDMLKGESEKKEPKHL